MSPENDPNLQPSTLDEPNASGGERISLSASAAAPADGRGAATAVARAPEAAESAPVSVETPVASEPPAASSEPSNLSASPVSSEAPAAAVSGSAAETAPVAVTDAGASDAKTSESGENETMDQLLEQFSTPETAVGEGEIFDGHVLAVIDAGVVVDV